MLPWQIWARHLSDHPASDRSGSSRPAAAPECHALANANATGNIGPILDDLAAVAGEGGGSPEDYVIESLLDPDAEVAQGFQPGVMPSNEGRLSEEQLQALAEYLLEGG
jgi:cytochrome c oxidase subunit 2